MPSVWRLRAWKKKVSVVHFALTSADLGLLFETPPYFMCGANGSDEIGRRSLESRACVPRASEPIPAYGIIAWAGVEGELSSLLELTAVVT